MTMECVICYGENQVYGYRCPCRVNSSEGTCFKCEMAIRNQACPFCRRSYPPIIERLYITKNEAYNELILNMAREELDKDRFVAKIGRILAKMAWNNKIKLFTILHLAEMFRYKSEIKNEIVNLTITEYASIVTAGYEPDWAMLNIVDLLCEIEEDYNMVEVWLNKLDEILWDIYAPSDKWIDLDFPPPQPRFYRKDYHFVVCKIF